MWHWRSWETAPEMARLWRRVFSRIANTLMATRLRFLGVEMAEGVVVTGKVELFRGGSPVQIGAHSHIRSARDEAPQVGLGPIRLMAQDGEGIRIGRHCAINRGVCVISRMGISIGDGVIVAPNVIMLDYDGHSVDPAKRMYIEKEVQSTGFYDEGASKGKIEIGNNVWIGLGAIILRGVHVGDHSVIGAGSVVRRNIPERTLVMGNPAEVVRTL